MARANLTTEKAIADRARYHANKPPKISRKKSTKIRVASALKAWETRRANGTDTRATQSTNPKSVEARRRRQMVKVTKDSPIAEAVGLARCNYCPNCGTTLVVVNQALDLTAGAAIGRGG